MECARADLEPKCQTDGEHGTIEVELLFALVFWATTLVLWAYFWYSAQELLVVLRGASKVPGI